MSDNSTTRLRELRGSGYEIATGQPDIRGWDVCNETGQKFGKVRELIFDIDALKVRYMVVEVKDVKELELEKRTILIPIGLAELHQADDDVILPEVTPFQLRALPRYDKSNLGAKTEYDVSYVFGRDHDKDISAAGNISASFYQHDHFNENNLYNRRNTVASSERLKDEMWIRKELEKAREKEREEASLLRDTSLEERVTFNRPEDVRQLDKEQGPTDETGNTYHRNPDTGKNNSL